MPADWAWWCRAEATDVVAAEDGDATWDPYEFAFDEVRLKLEAVGIAVLTEGSRPAP